MLQELPMSVRIVCARSNSHNASVGTSSGTKPDFPMIGGSIRSANEIMSSSSLMSSVGGAGGGERMFKAKSDGSISSSVADDTARDSTVAEQDQVVRSCRSFRIFFRADF